MTSGRGGGRDAVHVTADIGEGRSVDGEAWIRTHETPDRACSRSTTASPDGSTVTVRSRPERVATDGVSDGFDQHR